MKKYCFYLFTILTVFAFNSCDNEPLEGFDLSNPNSQNNGNINNTQTGIFQVDFDSQTFVADQISATRTDEVINISGLRGANGELVTLTIQGTTTGTYDLGVQNGLTLSGGSYVEPNNQGFGTWVSVTDGVQSQGQVTITSIDEVNNKMSGSFEFTGNNYSTGTAQTKAFTNGIFTDVLFQDGVGSSNNSNTFFAKLDGVEFVEDAANAILSNFSGQQILTINGFKNNGESLSLSIDGDIAPGTYSFDGFGNFTNTGQYVGDDPSEVYNANGTFTIISHDTTNNTISGTFSFIAEEFPQVPGSVNIDVTEGAFSVTY
ncbi:DUF6252 family protein [Aurantibacter aestuarii]|uniref:Transferrin-binding protein B C-lobe/N-lobe beta barrel domain-containing protein n=1 Tax=Aurantibacter aestuarii TaxID=1266046 RepID=A0A2T1N9N2_9FLAO|nr:DUF6252 family protein [Aurantibacter aestuarii]PSG88565.1 hypothetical protein C7H52_09735 [Aurantibacter aestuarii]